MTHTLRSSTFTNFVLQLISTLSTNSHISSSTCRGQDRQTKLSNLVGIIGSNAEETEEWEEKGIKYPGNLSASPSIYLERDVGKGDKNHFFSTCKNQIKGFMCVHTNAYL